MLKRVNIYKRFNLLILFVVTLTLLLTAIIMGIATNRIVDTVSMHYAQMYSSEIVTAVETHVTREIGLSLKMANTQAIVNWMKNESDLSLKRTAFKEFAAFTEILHDQNLFITVAPSKNMYFVDSQTTYDTFKNSGALSETNPEDSWYFEAISSDNDFILNLDDDRFLDIIRVWINVKVTDGDQILGCLGTGIYITSFIEEILQMRHDSSARTFIIDNSGIIQMDSLSKLDNQDNYESNFLVEQSIFNFMDDKNFHDAAYAYMQAPSKQLVIKIKDPNYQYVALSMIHDTNWYVVTFYSKDSFYTPLNLSSIFVTTITITLLMAFVINMIVRFTFVKPLMALTESVRRKEAYNDGTVFGTDRSDEFGILANSIEQMSERLVKSIPVGMFLLDEHYNLIYANEYFLNQFACHDKSTFQERLKSNPQSMLASIEEYPRIKELLSHKEALMIYETQFIDFNGNHFWAEIHMTTKTQENESLGYEGILINTQGKKSYEQKLLNLATTDSLTGIYNRHRFNEIVIEEKERSERYGGALSLIIFDLDHFKSINDTYGHIVGDEVLVETSQIAKSNLRNTDIIARWGGEEFAILLPGTNNSGACSVAEKIRVKLQEYKHPLVEKVTSSFGVAERLPNETYLDWFNRVDQALFKAKSQGRNQVYLSDQVANAEQSTEVNQTYSEHRGATKLVWQDRFNSGNETIDLQHRNLFELSNEMLALEFAVHNTEQMLALYNQFSKQLDAHIHFEEDLLSTIGYPELNLMKHIVAHQLLLDKLNALYNAIITSSLEAFTILIQDIVLDHLINEDLTYFDYLKK